MQSWWSNSCWYPIGIGLLASAVGSDALNKTADQSALAQTFSLFLLTGFSLTLNLSVVYQGYDVAGAKQPEFRDFQSIESLSDKLGTVVLTCAYVYVWPGHLSLLPIQSRPVDGERYARKQRG